MLLFHLAVAAHTYTLSAGGSPPPLEKGVQSGSNVIIRYVIGLSVFTGAARLLWCLTAAFIVATFTGDGPDADIYLACPTPNMFLYSSTPVIRYLQPYILQCFTICNYLIRFDHGYV